MFLIKKNLDGTHYYEFQYCKEEKLSKYLFQDIKNWGEDSIYLNEMDDESMLIFEEKYLPYFLNPFTPNGKSDYDPFGCNYYSKEQAQTILNELLVANLSYKEIICEWLQKCVDCYHGFFILGI